MMMRLRFLAPVVTLVATAAFAQFSAPHPDLTAITQYLDLTPAQVQSLETIRQQERTALQPLIQQLRTAEQALRQLMRNDGDPNDIAAAIANIQNIRQQIQQTRATYVTQAQAVLTEHQIRKLQALQAALNLVPTAREAVMLNLLTPPQGLGTARAGHGLRHGPGDDSEGR
jgi:Spy/CpxP family protein refolding chaperone